jgi:hypothetical protein
MRPGVGIFLIAAGAILRFAITRGSLPGLNVHIVGIILILAGVIGLLLSESARARLRTARLRTRRGGPGSRPVAYEESPADADPGGYDANPPLTGNLPT